MRNIEENIQNKNGSNQECAYIPPKADIVELDQVDVLAGSPGEVEPSPFGDKGGEGPTW